VIAVERPQRLHGHVEGAVAGLAPGPRPRHELHQFGRRVVEITLGVEAGKGGIRLIETVDRLKTRNFGTGAFDKALGAARLGRVDHEARLGAQCNAVPAVQRRTVGAVTPQKSSQRTGNAEAGCRGEDLQNAAACEWWLHRRQSGCGSRQDTPTAPCLIDRR